MVLMKLLTVILVILTVAKCVISQNG